MFLFRPFEPTDAEYEATVARALKLRAIGHAQDLGAKVIITDNEENNPMYQINLELGFEPRPAWLEYRKVLRE